MTCLLSRYGIGLVPMHGIGSRRDLPLPFSFVVAGAALALVLSFAVLFLAWRRPRYASVGGVPLRGLTGLGDRSGFRLVLQLVVLAVYGWAALALFAGKDLLTNPIFGFVFAWMWVGLVPSILLGPFWRATKMILVVLTTFSLAALWMSRYGADPARRAADYPRLMAGSIVPIAIGYAIAHYASLLVIEGQRTAINMSDPLGRGWNVFGSAEMGVNSALFTQPGLVALIQLGAIVTGHIVGIAAAQKKSLSLLRRDGALAGQAPMLLVMVCYTCSGLILLFSP